MGSHSRGSRLSLSPSVWDSRTRHCGMGLLQVRVRDIIKFSMGHPCPSLIPVQLESGGVHWTVCLCLYRFYASIDFTCPSLVESGGVHWTVYLCLSIDFTCPSLVLSSGVHWTVYLCLSIDFTWPSPVESGGVH